MDGFDYYLGYNWVVSPNGGERGGEEEKKEEKGKRGEKREESHLFVQGCCAS